MCISDGLLTQMLNEILSVFFKFDLGSLNILADAFFTVLLFMVIKKKTYE